MMLRVFDAAFAASAARGEMLIQQAQGSIRALTPCFYAADTLRRHMRRRRLSRRLIAADTPPYAPLEATVDGFPHARFAELLFRVLILLCRRQRYAAAMPC